MAKVFTFIVHESRTYDNNRARVLTQVHRIDPRVDVQDQFHFERFALAVQATH